MQFSFFMHTSFTPIIGEDLDIVSTTSDFGDREIKHPSDIVTALFLR